MVPENDRILCGGSGKSIGVTPLVLIMLICLYAGTLLLFKNKPTGFIPTEDEGRV